MGLGVIRRREGGFWLGALVAVVVVFMLQTTYMTMDDIANGALNTLSLRIFLEATGAVTIIPLLVIAAVAAVRWPVPPGAGRAWGRTLGAHALAFAVGTAIHTVLMAASRAELAPLLGHAGYSYGALHLRLLMEAPNDLIFYTGMVIARLLVDSRRRHREREREALELERALAQSRLENLQLQLQPHFLFNALNTISQVMYDDPRAADAMLDHLANLLRQALGRAGSAEVALGEELELLEDYLALARARFGDRLEIAVRASDEAKRAAVPPLLLQPLVENAMQHGIGPAGRGEVAITAEVERGRLRLAVENAVPAAVTKEPSPLDPRPSTPGLGLGLTVTSRRLALLYGGEATIDAGATQEGGYRVAIAIPLRRAGVGGSA